MNKVDLDDSWWKGITDERTNKRTDNAVSRVAFATEKKNYESNHQILFSSTSKNISNVVKCGTLFFQRCSWDTEVFFWRMKYFPSSFPHSSSEQYLSPLHSAILLGSQTQKIFLLLEYEYFDDDVVHPPDVCRSNKQFVTWSALCIWTLYHDFLIPYQVILCKYYQP